MNNVDILYLYPPSGRQKEFESALGLAYIQAYIKQFGYNSKQFIPKSMVYEDIINEIKDINPKVLGISTYDMNYYYAKIIAKRIKKELNIPVVIGGPTATFSYKTILDECCDFVDYISRGYGEVTTKLLLDYIIKGKGNLKNIPGLCYLYKGDIVCNELYSLPRDIDFFPSPYLSNIDFFPSRKIVLTSRGCFHNCVYCNCASMCNKKVFFHSIDRVISELEYIGKKSPGSYVLIGDDAFTLNIDRAKKICKLIIKKKIDLKLFCETRVDRVDYELLDLLKKAGFVKIDFGLESAVPKILRNIGKVFYTDDDVELNSEKKFLKNVQDVVLYCKELGLDPMVNIISGLPGESIEDTRKTLDFVKKLDINSYSHNYLKIYSGTQIFEEYNKWGYTVLDNVFTFPLIVNYPFDIRNVTPLNNSVSRAEVVRIKKEFISVFKKNQYLTVSDLNKINNRLQLNQELYFYVNDIGEKNTILNYIVNNDIPSNNIVFIEKRDGYLYCYNYLDKENYIQVQIVKDSKFDIPDNYYTLLYVENMTKEIQKRFDELNVNPFVNRFVLIKGVDSVENVEMIIADYCKNFNTNVEKILMKFAKYVNFDIDNLDINLFENIIYNNIFNLDEIDIIEKFLKYYLLGVDEHE